MGFIVAMLHLLQHLQPSLVRSKIVSIDLSTNSCIDRKTEEVMEKKMVK